MKLAIVGTRNPSISYEEFKEKLDQVKKHLFAKGVTVSWNDYTVSELEAILARGDRKLSKSILSAYKNGCIFDSWGEFFSAEKWDSAFSENGIEKQAYKAEIDDDSILCWEFIDVGVSKKFLFREKMVSRLEKVTGGCQTGCKGCGLEGRCTLL